MKIWCGSSDIFQMHTSFISTLNYAINLKPCIKVIGDKKY